MKNILMLKFLLQAPRYVKYSIFLATDIILSVFSVYAAFKLTGVWHLFANASDNHALAFILAPLIAIPVLSWFGLYRAITRFVGFSTVTSLVKASSLSAFIWSFLLISLWQPDRGLAVGIIYMGLLTASVTGVRVFLRWLLTSPYSKMGKAPDVRRYVIYGACDAGRELGRSMLENPHYDLVGYIDEDPILAGREVLGVPIISPSDMPQFISQYSVSDVLLAFNKESRSKRNELVSSLQSLNVRVRSLPMMSDLVSGSVSLSDIHDIDIDDLLGRPVVSMDKRYVTSLLKNKTVMVTGAGGSIGGELCRQILEHHPKVLVLYEWNEFALYKVHKELMQLMARIFEEGAGSSSNDFIKLLPRIVPLLGSVNDSDRLRQVMSAWQPTSVYHAAAYKHVPLVEHNLREGVFNNVFGTLKTAIASVEAGVENFVLVSTDKAVRPTNVMGATKRIAEMCLQALAQEKVLSPFFNEPLYKESKINTHFSMVRFGNVLGSSGSVVPLFKEQIYSHGPVTVTHPEVTRYFMSIPEAAQLVLQAGALHYKDQIDSVNFADVYVLDMGEPIKIFDLARKMIELYGFTVKDEYNPNGDIKIKVTGLRPGEKLYEELLLGENPQATSHPRISKAAEPCLSWSELSLKLKELLIAAQENKVQEVSNILKGIVSGYEPGSNNVDYLSNELDARKKI